MRKRILIAIGCVLLLSGCQAAGPIEVAQVPSAVQAGINDGFVPPTQAVSVTTVTEELDASLRSVFDEYLRLSALIAADGGANPERIETVTTEAWAEIEKQSSAALRGIGSTLSGEMTVTKWELASTRGRLRIIDALVHACLSRDSIKVRDSAGVETVASGTTLTTVHFVDSGTVFVIDDISPWEDSSWCAA